MNDLYRLAKDIAESLLGKERIISIPLPSLGGEDFAYYVRAENR